VFGPDYAARERENKKEESCGVYNLELIEQWLWILNERYSQTVEN
jgi:hypothetical protein